MRTFERRGTPYKQSLKAIHNYFFIKAMELLNEGGLLAFITSRGVADSPSNRFVRDYLVHHAISSPPLRLPDTLFMQTGGIEVGSDLYHLAKGQPQAKPHHKGTPVLGNVQGAHIAGAGNRTRKQGLLFAAKHVVHRSASAQTNSAS